MLEVSVKSFNELSTTELYKILQLRNAVFIVSQNCPYQDLDDKDFVSHHLVLIKENKFIAYARLLPENISYNEVSIGRVCVSESVRNTGTGRALMDISIEKCHNIFGLKPIRISAQLYLKKFYESFGFETVGNEYDEDGIPHIEMLKK